MNIYYVYAYLRSKDSDTAKSGTPYYIGKGKGNRAVCSHPGVSVPKDRTKIVFIEQNLTNVGACAIERRLIAWYGRKDIKTGILLNRTSGGDGGRGGSPKGRVLSEQTRKKISEAGRKRVHTEETKQKIRDAHTGKKRPPFSEEWRTNLSKARIGKPGRPCSETLKQHLSDLNSQPVYCVTNDTWYKSKKEAAVILGLKAPNIRQCLQGYQKTTGGFTFAHKKYDDPL